MRDVPRGGCLLSAHRENVESKFLHDIGPGITPVITSHGDVNFFEKSFEKAMTEGDINSSKLPSLKGLVGLNSKMKLNSIQLISPPSDTNLISPSGSVFNSSCLKRSHSNDQYSQSSGVGIQLTPESIPEERPSRQKTSLPRHPNVPLYHPPMVQQHTMIPVFIDQSIAMNMAGAIPGSMVPHPPTHPALPPEMSTNQMWAASIQKAKASSLEKQIRFQEKNRIAAAMKSRQRKKQEWERLQNNEKALREENQRLLNRIASLERELESLRSNPETRQS